MIKQEIRTTGVLTRDHCPVCGGFEKKLRWKKANSRLSLDAHLYECKSCALVYSQEFLTRDAAVEYYESLYREGNYQAYSTQKTTKVKNYARVLIGLKSQFSSDQPRHLDLGCGEGYGMLAAQAVGFSSVGVELCSSAAHKAKALGVGDVYVADLDGLNELSLGSFDVITWFDSFDHIADPLAALKAAATKLKASGVIYMNVTNIRSIYVALMRSRFPHLCPYEHLSYFSRKSLEKVLELAGLRCVQMTSEKRDLNLDYFLSDCKENNPSVYRMLSPLVRLIPRPVRRFDVSLPFGTLEVIAVPLK